jgi:hypothetical protein
MGDVYGRDPRNERRCVGIASISRDAVTLPQGLDHLEYRNVLRFSLPTQVRITLLSGYRPRRRLNLESAQPVGNSEVREP